MSKNVVEVQVPQPIRRLRVACWISTAVRAKALVRAHALTPTHTHTEMCNITAFPQQSFGVGASMLRYTYIASLVFFLLGSQSF